MAVFVVHVDLEVGQGGEVARFRHHIAAVAHEVVLATVKGGVVWVSRCYAGGCSCVKRWWGNIMCYCLLWVRVTNMFHADTQDPS